MQSFGLLKNSGEKNPETIKVAAALDYLQFIIDFHKKYPKTNVPALGDRIFDLIEDIKDGLNGEEPVDGLLLKRVAFIDSAGLGNPLTQGLLTRNVENCTKEDIEEIRLHNWSAANLVESTVVPSNRIKL